MLDAMAFLHHNVQVDCHLPDIFYSLKKPPHTQTCHNRLRSSSSTLLGFLDSKIDVIFSLLDAVHLHLLYGLSTR